MGLARFAWMAILACGAAAAYGIYAPEATDRWVPLAGGLAHQLHNKIWTPPSQTASAPGQGQPGQTAGPAPIVVSVTPVKRADFPVVLESLGQVQAYNTVTVRARVDGQIMKIAFNEGQMVKQGDLLAQIDPRPFQAALDQAKAKKAQDEANLANAKLDLSATRRSPSRTSPPSSSSTRRTRWSLQLIAQIAADAAAIDAAQVAARLYDDPRADLRPGGFPPRRRGQSRQRRAADRHRVDRPVAADRGHLHRAGGGCRRASTRCCAAGAPRSRRSRNSDGARSSRPAS